MINGNVYLPPHEKKTVSHFLFRTVGKKKSFTLFAIVSLISVLDLVGIAVIFPFLQVATQPLFIEKLMGRLGLSGLMSTYTHGQLVGIFGISISIFYALKTFFQLVLLRVEWRLLAGLTSNLTNDVISNLLHARYAVFQQTPASEIVGTVYSNTIHGSIALAAYIQAVTEGLLLAFLFFGFLYVQPMIALGTLLLAVFIFFLIYQIVVLRAGRIGLEQNRLENIRYKLLFAIASAIRDIKIMGLDNLFDIRNRKVSHDYVEIASRFSFNNVLPRLLIEFIALQTIVIFSLAVVFFELPLNKEGPLLGLIAIAAFRAIPSISRLFNAISTYKSSLPFIEKLMKLMKELEDNAVFRINDNLDFHNLIELKNIGFSYGDKKILDNVCLQIKRGESIGIVGPSGSGKSTLLDLFTGLQHATEGEFICDGKRFDPFCSHSIQELVGYVPQTITLLDETISFNVSFEEEPDYERIMQVLGMANLHEFIASLPDGIRTQVGENGLRLSGGQRQRLGIARALYRSPQILILDEATSSLDTYTEREINAEIEKLHGKISVMIVAHRLSTIMLCDRIYVLCNGVIECAGTHSELLLSSKVYNRLYRDQYMKNSG